MNAHAEIFQAGERFRGYVIDRLLGHGGLGAVYLATHEMLGSRVAVKALYPEIAAGNGAYVKRFLREAKIATRIRHPNLVAVHDCGFDEARGIYYIVMDYVRGGDLRQAIAFAGKFAPDRAVEVILQVAGALEAAQRHHVVHRDIKPENIMIQPDGLVKLVDLGIAKSDDLRETLNTTDESVFGTPAYVAPEQAIDPADVDARADIYSLGVVLFEMIAGKPPFEGESAPQILAQTLSDEPFPDIRDYNRDVSPQLAVLIRRMCVKERTRRIAGPVELLAEFARIGYRPATAAAAPAGWNGSADSAPTVRSVREVLDRLPARANPTLSFETDDREICDFVSRLKSGRNHRRRLRTAAIAAATIAAAALAAVLLF